MGEVQGKKPRPLFSGEVDSQRGRASQIDGVFAHIRLIDPRLQAEMPGG